MGGGELDLEGGEPGPWGGGEPGPLGGGTWTLGREGGGRESQFPTPRNWGMENINRIDSTNTLPRHETKKLLLIVWIDLLFWL